MIEWIKVSVALEVGRLFFGVAMGAALFGLVFAIIVIADLLERRHARRGGR